MKVDLHMHTACSDGVYPPEQLVEMACRAGLGTIAITDHDTVAAYEKGSSFSKSLRVIPGIEISSEYEGEDVHILGFYIDPSHPAVLDYTAQFQERRRKRVLQIVQRCADLGYVMPEKELNLLWEKNGTVGRPHMARILVKEGYFPSVKAVFDQILYRNGPAYVPYKRFTISQCIDIIHAAGGLAVLAHPGLIKKNLEAVLQYPFDGLEAYHPDNRNRCHEFCKLAEKRHWYISGGSDFHGVPGRFPEKVGVFPVEGEWVKDLLEYR